MKRVLLLALAISGMTVFGKPLKAQERNTMIGEEIVAVVGNSMILWSDIIEAMKALREEQRQNQYTSNKDPQCEALEFLLMRQMLANQARIDSLDINTAYVEAMVEDQVEMLLEEYGSMRAMEAVYRKPIYQIRDDLREFYTDIMYAQAMEHSIKGEVTVIPSEVDRFYRKVPKDSLPTVPEQYVYSQIVMYPPSIEEAKFRTRERLLEFRERIINGDNFAVLARLYSEDPLSAKQGGVLKDQGSEYMNINMFVRPFAETLEKLKVGQLSPVVETEHGFHIMEVLERKGENYRARHILLKPKYTQEEMIETAQRLDSIGRAIRNGEITFEEAALQYSQDEYSKYNGGKATNRELLELSPYRTEARDTKHQFFREELVYDHDHIRALKPGEISASYITQDLTGNQQVKIVRLDEIIPPHRANINEDYAMIEDMALTDKQNRIYNEWLQKKIDAMYIKIDPKFMHCEFDNKGWIK